jgi:hypothetical protein
MAMDRILTMETLLCGSPCARPANPPLAAISLIGGSAWVPAPDFSPGKRVFKPAETTRHID